MYLNQKEYKMIKPEQTYQQLIFEGIQMLPPDALAEIVDFILCDPFPAKLA